MKNNWILKYPYLTAVPYEAGMEHGFDEYGSEKAPEGMYKAQVPDELLRLALHYTVPTGNGAWLCRIPYVVSWGDKRHIKPGDYIVSNGTGGIKFGEQYEEQKYPVTRAWLDEKYEPVA